MKIYLQNNKRLLLLVIMPFLQLMAYYLFINNKDVLAALFLLSSMTTIPYVVFSSGKLWASFKECLVVSIPIPAACSLVFIGIMVLGSLQNGRSDFTIRHLNISYVTIATFFLIMFTLTLPIMAGSFAIKKVVTRIRPKL